MGWFGWFPLCGNRWWPAHQTLLSRFNYNQKAKLWDLERLRDVPGSTASFFALLSLLHQILYYIEITNTHVDCLGPEHNFHYHHSYWVLVVEIFPITQTGHDQIPFKTRIEPCRQRTCWIGVVWLISTSIHFSRSCSHPKLWRVYELSFSAPVLHINPLLTSLQIEGSLLFSVCFCYIGIN